MVKNTIKSFKFLISHYLPKLSGIYCPWSHFPSLIPNMCGNTGLMNDWGPGTEIICLLVQSNYACDNKKNENNMTGVCAIIIICSCECVDRGTNDRGNHRSEWIPADLRAHSITIIQTWCILNHIHINNDTYHVSKYIKKPGFHERRKGKYK